MPQKQLAVLSCIEHERLEFEVSEVRTRRQYLTRLCRLSCHEQAEWSGGSSRRFRVWWSTNWSMGAAVEGLTWRRRRKVARDGTQWQSPVIVSSWRSCGAVPGARFESANPTNSFAKFPISSTEVRDDGRKSKITGSGHIAD